MKLSIRSLAAQSKPKPLEFSGKINLSFVRFWGLNPFPEEILISGQVIPSSYGTFLLQYTLNYCLVLECFGCLKKLRTPLTESFSHTLQAMDQEEDVPKQDDFLPVYQDRIDLTEVVSSDLLLALDDTMLCSPDCKGICPICGVDRNHKLCDCVLTIPDTRFDKLRELLDKSSQP